MKKIIPFVLSLLLLASCEKVFFKPEPENAPEAVFNELWTGFDEYYASFEARHVDWDSVYAEFAPLINNQMNDDELHIVITSVLAVLDDGHVTLTVPGKEVFASNRYYRDTIGKDLFDPEVVKSNYLNNSFEEDEAKSFIYGTINGNIIYLHLPYTAENLPIIDEVLDKYPDANGMIIDLRHNAGGDFSWALQYFVRLTDVQRLTFSSATKNGPGPNDYEPWYDWYLESSGPYFNKKIAVLTDRFTISAGERAVMALKVLPNVVQIGDTTNGAHSTMIGRELQNGWYYSLGPQQIKFADGKSYEGIGMIPNIVVHNTLSHLQQGVDDVLETAIFQLQ